MCALAVFLIFKQIIKINLPMAAAYEVKGIDVSHYQGKIDWQILSQGQDFAYIKATEGSSFTDENFAYNYEKARESGLRVGAYHFFSFDSPAKVQAENFISQVKSYDGMLPPVIDVEYYGNYFADPPSAEEVIPKLKELADILKKEYGTDPVIYSTGSAYARYIKGTSLDRQLWRRDVYLKPSGNWVFWQYSSVGRLKGYNGKEKYIDLNVFNGTREEFEEYGIVKD